MSNIDEIYNNWQTTELYDVGEYQFTKSELLNFAEYYHKEMNLMDGDIYCVSCGDKLTIVRPGKYQCDNECCVSNT